ncbi:hypothetical protein KIPB_009366 [Kipferlia bialata]|uniref:Uncharacterized protein n=1 Tax=Kipferlia bialata TaxID=797122 RepID=A0A9K3D277_9EUKA|nr:hypothetical protein KIPB_009366 [Kipferlia bialata]|eukprot:g9366.t1
MELREDLDKIAVLEQKAARAHSARSWTTVGLALVLLFVGYLMGQYLTTLTVTHGSSQPVSLCDMHLGFGADQSPLSDTLVDSEQRQRDQELTLLRATVAEQEEALSRVYTTLSTIAGLAAVPGDKSVVGDTPSTRASGINYYHLSLRTLLVGATLCVMCYKRSEVAKWISRAKVSACVRS